MFHGMFETSRLRNGTADIFFRYFDDGCLQCRRDGGSTRNLMHLQRSSESQKVEYFRVRSELREQVERDRAFRVVTFEFY